MSGRKFILPVISAIALTGGAAAYYYFNVAVGNALSPQAIAKVVPDNAYMAAFISMDEKTWSRLEQFGTPEAQKLIGQGLKDARQKMFTDYQVDYDKDVKPWVGNAMVAFLPTVESKAAQATIKVSQEPTKASQEPNMLIVVGIKDKLNALNFANKLKGELKVKATESDYKGVKITNFLDQQKQPNYTAVVKDYLVISPQKSSVEQAIDTIKGKPSLAAKAGNDLFKAKGMDIQNSVAQVYIPDYAGAMQQLLKGSPTSVPLSAATLDQFKQIKSIVAGAGIDDAGIRLKAVANLDEKFAMTEFKPSSSSIVAQFPTDTFAMVSGSGVDRYWVQAVKQANAIPETQLAIGAVRQQAKMVGIDLDQDVFAWMNGEFAFGLIPSNQGILAPVGFGGVMLFDTTDRKTAETTLTKLDTLVGSNFLTVGQRSVQGKTVTEWKVPQGVTLGHGWLDQDTLFVALGGPMADVVTTKPNQPLDRSEEFKTITGSLKKPNLGYFYLDLDKTMALLNRTILVSQKNTIPPETAAILNSIRGLGVTASQPDKATSEYEMLLALKPTR